MDCSTRHTKDFIQILKLAKKTINLLKASILYASILYFYPPSQLDGPHNNRIPLPLRSPMVVHFLPSLTHHLRVHGWLLRAVNDWRPPKATTNFGIFIFLPEIRYGQNDLTASSPIAATLRAVSPKYIPTTRLTFGWLLCPPIQQEPLNCKAPSPSLFLFVCRSICRTKRWVHVLPHAFRPFAYRISNALPPHRHHCLVGCCISPPRSSHPRPCSAHLSIFPWAPFRRPKQQGDQQLLQARGPGASSNSLMGDGEPLRRDLGLWRMLPWRVMAMPLGVGWCSS